MTLFCPPPLRLQLGPNLPAVDLVSVDDVDLWGWIMRLRIAFDVFVELTCYLYEYVNERQRQHSTNERVNLNSLPLPLGQPFADRFYPPNLKFVAFALHVLFDVYLAGMMLHETSLDK